MSFFSWLSQDLIYPGEEVKQVTNIKRECKEHNYLKCSKPNIETIYAYQDPIGYPVERGTIDYWVCSNCEKKVQ